MSPHSFLKKIHFFGGQAHRFCGIYMSLKVFAFMAIVAQLVEPTVVVRVVAGSSPVSRPIFLLYPIIIGLTYCVCLL